MPPFLLLKPLSLFLSLHTPTHQRNHLSAMSPSPTSHQSLHFPQPKNYPTPIPACVHLQQKSNLSADPTSAEIDGCAYDYLKLCAPGDTNHIDGIFPVALSCERQENKCRKNRAGHDLDEEKAEHANINGPDHGSKGDGLGRNARERRAPVRLRDYAH